MAAQITVSAAILACAALGLIVWDVLCPRRLKSLLPGLALAALALAFAFWAGGIPSPRQESLVADRLQRALGALYLMTAGLSLLVEEGTTGPPRRAESYILRLLAAVGALLALSAQDAILLGIGLELHMVALAWAYPNAETSKHNARPFGVGALFFGLALLYTVTGTSNLAVMGERFWVYGGPRAGALYFGLALTLGGIGVLGGLLPPYAHDARPIATSTLVAVGALGRIGLDALGALAWEWSWVLAVAAVAALAWGGLGAAWPSDLQERLMSLSVAQRGFLLLSLTLLFERRSVPALYMTLFAFVLAQIILSAHLSRIKQADDPREACLTGLVKRAPWLGMPLLVSLLSMGGIPGTLGFVGRFQSFWLLREAGQGGLEVIWTLAGVLCLYACARWAWLLVRGRPSSAPLSDTPWPLRIGLALAALGLLAFGLYPAPLLNL